MSLPVFARTSGQAKPAKKKAKVASVETRREPRSSRRLGGGGQEEPISPSLADGSERWAGVSRTPREQRMRRSRSWDGDLRSLPQTTPVRRERPERKDPPSRPRFLPGGAAERAEAPASASVATLNAPAPAPSANFDGLDFANWGAGHPPDTNGDVGPAHYIETINTSIGIFNKSDGSQAAAFTFDTFMSQGNFGNICDTENFGDPVVLYDTFEDRWVITDFAFRLSGQDVLAPALQCFAVSKTGDPISGGWNFYSVETLGGLGDYPKLGIWPDGIYMTTNMFGYASTAGFQGARVFAFNKAQMYAGAPTVQIVTFDAPPADFTVLPSNARLQTGTPPPGAPNYFLSTWQFLNGLTVYKFHVDWDHISLSTFTGPDVPIAATSWPNANVANAPSLGSANLLDVLQIRAMAQNQYSNIGGVESLWATHTVRRANTTGFAAPRWYQVNVTGGTVAPNIPQAATWDPDAANVIHRFMPSLAVNRNGDLALGYSTSSSTTKPAIMYAGRLATDPVNTFSQTEQLLVQGAGTQIGTSRWGDYSAMSLDPDGCTFWYTNMYYKVDGLDHQTRIGAFAFPGCTPIGEGMLSGTVTRAGSGSAIAGATVALGSRTTTTNVFGNYSFTLPAGTYPSVTASHPGFNSRTFTGIVLADGGVTTQDFALTAAPIAGCSTDTTQGDFQAGVPTNVDLTTSPGDVTLPKPDVIDVQNTTLGSQGAGFNTTTWLGQTFTVAGTGPLVRVDVNFFSLNCAAVTMPDLTVSIRNAAANVPTGTDLATATIPGFCNGGGGFYTVTFASPLTVTAGTQYALTWRAAAAIPAGTPAPGYFGTVSAGTGTVAVQNPYAGGRRASSANSGTTWTGASGNANNDHGFKIYINHGYAASGNFVSAVKDANPVPGAIPNWGTLAWTATTPTGTDIQFHAAASNSVTGPFNFVGPDGTTATSFSNGGSLAQFNGRRYLRYRATLTSTDTTATPTLNDVTICFDDVPATTTLTVGAAGGTYGSTANLGATLTAGPAVSGKTVSFTLNGTPVGSGTTNGSGVASVIGASLTGIAGGTYPGGVAATFAGDAGYMPASGSNTLTVTPATQTITFAPLADKAVGAPDFPVTATASSGLDVTFTAGGNCTVTPSGSAVHLTGAGSCTITAFQGGDGNYSPAPPVPRSFSIGIANQTITFGPLPNRTFGEPDFGIGAISSSGLAVGFTASGVCTVTPNGSAVHLTGLGSCTITASQPGNADYNPAPNVLRSFFVNSAAVSCPTSPVLPGASFTTTLSGGSSATDWIASYLVGAPGSPVPPYQYVPLPRPITQAVTAPGTAGTYELRLSANDTFALIGFCTYQVSAGVALSINDVTVTEGNSGAARATFNVTLSPASAGTVTVNFATANGTATAGSDYVTSAGTLTFNPGDTIQTVTVLVNGDTTPEPNETFVVNLTSPSGATFLDAQGQGNITNDDGAPPAVTCPSVVSGGNSNLDWMASYPPGAPSSPVPPYQYVPLPRPITRMVTAPSTVGTYELRLLANDAYGVIGSCLYQVATGPALSINDVTVTEGNSGTVSATFDVTLSPLSSGTVTVNFATADGTATSGSDYQATTGLLTFNAGESVKTVTVLVNGDTTPEANETFVVNLTTPSGATIQDGQGQGTITNDDGAPPALSCPTSMVARGASFTTTVTGGATAKDWVATFAPAAPNTTWLGQYQYVALPRPAMVGLIAPGTAGTYELRLLANDAFTLIGSSCTYQVGP
jgi:ribosomal protein L35AE/L33A